LFTHPTDGAAGDIPGGITPLIVRVGTVADGGSNQIVNPPTVADYEITIENTYNASGGGVETGEVTIPIVDDDTVDVRLYLDTYLTFDIDTAVTDTNCDASGGTSPCNSHGGTTDGAGYVVDLGEMTLESVNTSGDDLLHADGLTGAVNYIWFDLETNAVNGAIVSVVSQYDGLQKDGSNIIPSFADGSESTISFGSGLYGMNHPSGLYSAASIGAITVDGDCDASGGSSSYCGVADGGTPIDLFHSGNSPLDDGRVQFAVGAAPDSADGTGTYTDQLTFVATSTF
jgi:hypothetical protein